MILAHSITGLSITYIVKKSIKKLTPQEEKIFWITGITSSILPDFDLALALFTNQNSHHHFITHTPIFYLVIGLFLATILLIIEKINENKECRFLNPYPKLKKRINKITPHQIQFCEQLIILFLANTIIHILMDVPAGSISPFWPIYNETFTIFNLSSNTNWFTSYINSPAIYIELFWFIIGLLIIIENRKKKEFKTALLSTAFWLTIAIISAVILIWYQSI